MSAAEALKMARAAGIELRLDGADLVLEASAPPPDVVLELLRRHKPGVMDLLRPGRDGWSAADWQAFFDERVVMAEFDGGLPRLVAEMRAFACCVWEWRFSNPADSPADRCAECGGPHRSHDPLHAVIICGETQGWLHRGCSTAWHAARRAEAAAALASMGIAAPAKAEAIAALAIDQPGTSQ